MCVYLSVFPCSCVSCFCVCRLQQQVQNPISDNTNVLWNSPSLGKNTAIGYPWFYKTTPFLSFEGKKTGSNSSVFFWYSPLFGKRQKQLKISGIALFSISIKLGPHYFSINLKEIFPTKSTNCLLHSTTNHFFSFHLCQ